MTKLNQINKNEVKVENNGEMYGTLKFNSNAREWVLWPNQIDDAVSYFEDLAETEEAIVDELA